jgi:hypothetical protein
MGFCLWGIRMFGLAGGGRAGIRVAGTRDVGVYSVSHNSYNNDLSFMFYVILDTILAIVSTLI